MLAVLCATVFVGCHVLNDATFTHNLFRFLQLLCEGHNEGTSKATVTDYFTILYTIDFQNNLRTQAGNTTTVNIVVHTVDYLLRLQVSVITVCLPVEYYEYVIYRNQSVTSTGIIPVMKQLMPRAGRYFLKHFE